MFAVVIGYLMYLKNQRHNTSLSSLPEFSATVTEVAPANFVQVTELKKIITTDATTNVVIIRDKGASFNVVASSKTSPAPVAPVNPYLK
jgi:hypothetical protein